MVIFHEFGESAIRDHFLASVIVNITESVIQVTDPQYNAKRETKTMSVSDMSKKRLLVIRNGDRRSAAAKGHPGIDVFEVLKKLLNRP